MDHTKELKTLARSLGRALRIRLFEAQNLTAQLLGHSHWVALATAMKAGWQPDPSGVDRVRGLLEEANPLGGTPPPTAGVDLLERIPGVRISDARFVPRNEFDWSMTAALSGKVDDHPFVMRDDGEDVTMIGRGWEVVVYAAPSAPPYAGVTDRRFKPNPIEKEGFRAKAVSVAGLRAAHVRARMASEWSRRMLVPDAKGVIEHPVFGDCDGSRWWCNHCEQELTSAQVTENMWRCPECHASPLDIWLYQEEWDHRQASS